jgi:hypothetical protein
MKIKQLKPKFMETIETKNKNKMQWILRRNPDFPLDNDTEEQLLSNVYDKCDDIEYLS